MNPTTVYRLGEARRDELASAVRRARRSGRPAESATGRPAVLTRWVQRLGGVSVS